MTTTLYDGATSVANGGVGGAVYARISETDDTVGVDRQIEEGVERGIAFTGVPVAHRLVDNDLTGTTRRGRTDFERLEALVLEGEVSYVVVQHTDRLARNAIDQLTFYSLLRTAGVPLYDWNGEVDLRTAGGKLYAGMKAVVDQFYADSVAEKQKQAHAARKAKGLPKRGSAGFGHRWEQRNGSAVFVVDESEAPHIRDALRRVRSGEASPRSIAVEWDEAGVPTRSGAKWYRQTVRSILLSPRIAGLARDNDGRLIEGQWEAIVDRDEWEALVAQLGDPTRNTTSLSNNRRYWLTGLLRCSVCRNGMRHRTLSRRATGEPHSNATYTCNGLSKGCALSVTEAAAEAYVEEAIVAAMERNATELAAASTDLDSEIGRLVDEQRTLDERAAAIGEMLALGKLDVDAGVAANETLRAERLKVEHRLSMARSAQDRTQTLAAASTPETFATMNAEQRHAVATAYFVNVWVAPAQSTRGPIAKRLELEWRD